MKTQPDIELLSRRYFIIGLIILLINDFILKYYLHNEFTGKLSDFAGLFIFPYFFAVFFRRKTKIIYLLTGIGFLFWKSPLSDSFVQYWNDKIFFSIYRVKDYTDLVALIILPFSYAYLNKTSVPKNKIRLAISYVIGFIAIFAFCATTQPRQEFKLNAKVEKQYVLPYSKKDLFQKLNFAYGYSDTIEKNLLDTMFYCYFDLPDKWAHLTSIAKIKEVAAQQTIIKLDSVTSFTIKGLLFKGINYDNVEFVKKLTPFQLENYFEQNYINVLLNKKPAPPGGLFFDNKELIDKYIKY